MSGTRIVGLVPWLPWPLNRSPWWTAPVRAERLAALRIGLAVLFLADVLLYYGPWLPVFYGANSLGDPEVFAWVCRAPRWSWTPLRSVHSLAVIEVAFAFWIVTGVGLLLGFWTRCCAAVSWALSVSLSNLNPYVENAGDEVRTIILFYLMLSPCGAVWSLDAGQGREREVVLVPPWPLRLLFVQMVLIYFMNGLYKAGGADWQAGDSLYYVLADLTLARWSYAQLPLPVPLTRWLTWLILGWELAFPALMLAPGLAGALTDRLRCPDPWRRGLRRAATALRTAGLLFGVAFHVGIALCLEIGMFAPYMLCLYLPLLPWERWADRHVTDSRVGCSTER
ncbi:MAG: HTTM domain-containing protein [Gemmataceae bacterium]|nr:HTTM domain-containing protein [Gemmataceae bacterium]MDW8264988.1 HTTM domain-containing protein [Gemmataceae bacterium]